MSDRPIRPNAASTPTPAQLSESKRQPRDLPPLSPDRRTTDGSDATPATATIATSASAALLFELTDHPEGIHVTRVLRRDDGDKVYCSALVGDERMFLDWLDADALRYAHPLVFQQARRCFAQLMAQRVHHDPVLG